MGGNCRGTPAWVSTGSIGHCSIEGSESRSASLDRNISSTVGIISVPLNWACGNKLAKGERTGTSQLVKPLRLTSGSCSNNWRSGGMRSDWWIRCFKSSRVELAVSLSTAEAETAEPPSKLPRVFWRAWNLCKSQNSGVELHIQKMVGQHLPNNLQYHTTFFKSTEGSKQWEV